MPSSHIRGECPACCCVLCFQRKIACCLSHYVLFTAVDVLACYCAPCVSLQERYLQGRKERMQRILQEATAVADAMESAAQAHVQHTRSSGGGDSGAPLPSVEDPASWGVDAGGAVPSLSAFVKALDERVINAMQETVMNMNTIFLQVCSPAKMLTTAIDLVRT